MVTGILDILRMMTTPCFVLNADGEMLGCSHSFNAEPVLVLHQHELVNKAAAQLSYQHAQMLQVELLQKKYMLSMLQVDNEQCRCWLVSCQLLRENTKIGSPQSARAADSPAVTITPTALRTAVISNDQVMQSDIAEFVAGREFSTQLRLLAQRYQLYDLEQQLTQAQPLQKSMELMIGEQRYLFVPQQIAGTGYLLLHQQLHSLKEPDLSALLQSFETLVGGIVIMDTHGNIRYLSRQITLNFPYFTEHAATTQTSELLARAVMYNCRDFNDHQVAVTLRWLRQQLKQHRKVRYNFQLLDGRSFQYRDYVQANGSRVGLISDDTTAKMLDQLLQHAATHTENANNQQLRLISTLSHEIRTPLHAIVGLVELLMADPVLGKHQYIATIDRTTRHLVQLLNDVLDLSKLESEQARLQLVETDLRRLCEDVLESFVAKAKLKGLKTEVYIDPAIHGHYLCDALRLRQVLQNLLSNSVKFTSGQHGIVRLDLLAEAEDQHKQQISFHVIDNGIGISAEQQKYIFDSFTQATPDIYYRFGGTGLGLSISSYICRLMDCTLQVQSQLDQGAHFYFETSLSRVSRADWQLPTHIQQQPVFSNSKALQALLSRYQCSLPFNSRFCSAEQMLQPTTNDQVRLLDLTDPAIIDKQLYLQQYEMLPGSCFVINSTQAQKFSTEHTRLLEMYPFRLNEWLQALQMPPPSILPEPQIVVPTAKHQLRILLVDDHHENLYVLQQQLAALGYQSDTASDAETAYNLCQLQHYQLLITDYQLSGWNGAELAYHLRSYERQYQLAPSQIWVLTGNNTLSCQHECDSSAVDLLLIKPCTLAVLEQQFTLLNDRLAAADEADSYPECIVDIDRELAFNRDALVNTDTIMMFTGPLEPQHLKTTLEQFRQYLCKQQTLLHTAAQQKNRQLLTEIFHNIKSTARYYGSDTLSLMAENNEYAAADPALFNLNEAELARFNNQLNEVIEKFIELEQSYEH